MRNETTPVLLLKTRSAPSDGYADFFSSSENGHHEPIFVPVLEHRFNETALLEIRRLIEDVAISKLYSGIIFTSQRAVEAFSKVVEDLRKANVNTDRALSSKLPLYVVGPATARGLNSLELQCPILGQESGNGDALAAFILEDANARIEEPDPRAMLFLVGEQRRDIIPKTLQSEDLPVGKRLRVEELVVYETGVMESFPSDFAASIRANIDRPQWIVVFSPTGCEAMLQGIGQLDPETGKSLPTRDARYRVATIGPTTRDYLVRQFGFMPDVCASKPSPEGLGSAIREHMESLQNG